VQQLTKHFADQLNKILDELDAPSAVRERAVILGKMLDVPKQDAWSMLEGHMLPDAKLLQKIADELEVDVKWLTGQETNSN
jgi:hypothetical protein